MSSAAVSPSKTIEHLDIPVEMIVPNPRNPRPLFHLADDDPFIDELAKDLTVQGQFQDAMVFRLEGHWCEPDRPGMYMLLQGERRWRATRVADLPTLRCQVIETPQDKKDELYALGAEGSYKEHWQPFYVMKWARDLAAEMGLAMDNPVVRQRTGLTKLQLVEANKMFSLHPDIIARVERYEEEKYRQRQGSMRKVKPGRLKTNDAGITEFTVGKAASVWDLFVALRENFSPWDLVNDRTDLDLQNLLADAACGRRSKHALDNLVTEARANKAGSCDVRLKIELEKILTKRTTIGDAGGRFNFADLERYRGFEKRCETMTGTLSELNRRKYFKEAELSEADMNRGIRKLAALSKQLDVTVAALERRAQDAEDARDRG